MSYFDRRSLFCSSVNIFESLQKSTPYCVYSGNEIIYEFADHWFSLSMYFTMRMIIAELAFFQFLLK